MVREPTGVVRNLRRDLWAKYCGLLLPVEMPLFDSNPPGYDDLLDIDKALRMWSLLWGVGGLPSGAKLRSEIKGFKLPMMVTTPYSKTQHDREDPDSRMPF
jgi:hypothetical protein